MSKFDAYFLRLKQDCGRYINKRETTSTQQYTAEYIGYIKQHRLLHILPASQKDIKHEKIAQQARGLQHTAELIRVMTRLESKKINVLTFKGPALSQLLYNDASTRFYKDIDIWAEQKEILDIIKLLFELGYESKIKNISAHIISNNFKDISLRHNEKNVEIEVHWKITNSEDNFYLTFERAWQNRQSVKIHGQEINTLSNSDYYHYLCYHGHRHFWRRLNWLLDVVLLQKITPHPPKNKCEKEAAFLIKTLFENKRFKHTLSQKIMLSIIKQDPAIIQTLKIWWLKACYIVLTRPTSLVLYFYYKLKRDLFPTL